MKRIFILLICLVAFTNEKITAQVITTIAGDGTMAYSGDGGLGTAAQVFAPSGITLDASGNLYFADAGNNRIRKIDKQTGVISTIAGNGADGFAGDGGLAVNAALKQPSDIAFDASGNMYIADQYNKRIRKVDLSTGIISTIAGDGSATNFGGDGGLAINAHLSYPSHLALDAVGNIYISDYNNSRIRKIDAATGIITTICGLGNYVYYTGDGGPATDANIAFPAGIKVDADGNIYFADQSNNCIRKIDAGTGIINTIAGNGIAGFSGDAGIATNANLNQPYSLSLDAAGNIFFSDFSNFRIRKIDKATGIITTVTGTGVAGFSGDGGVPAAAQIQSAWGVAAGANGTVYFADTENQRIRRIGLPAATNISCATATEIIPSAPGNASYGNPITGSNIGVAGIPGTVGECDNGYLIYSLWYKFVATQSNHRIVIKDPVPNANNFAIQFYLGDNCSNIVPEDCYSALGWGDSSTHTVTNLIPGQTYYFRVKTYEYNYHEGTFTIYVTSPALLPAPANDDLCSAQEIIPSADASCDPIAGSTSGATPRHIPYNGFHDQLNDVWYSFVATQAYHKIVIKGFGFNGAAYFFDGNCTALNYHFDASNYAVADSMVLRYSDLIPGNTYYLEIGNVSTENNIYNFTVCVTSPASPANDLCNAAVVLTPSAVFVGTPGTTADALGNATTCAYHDDDVWYKFTATDATHKIIVKCNSNLFIYNSGIEFLSGTDCNAYTSAGCANYLYDFADSIFYEATSLIPGNTYYFTVHTTAYSDLAQRDFLVGVTGGPLGCTYSVPDINSGIITASFGSICDFNGDSDYSDNLNGYTVIYPVVPGGLVKLDFTVFNTDVNDVVNIYDGVDLSAPLLFSGSGNLSTLPSVASATGPLTIEFISNADAITGPGFSALISNLPNPCPAAILYVDAAMPSSGDGTSWSTAFKTLSEALYVANRCMVVTEVHVSQGTYYPSADDGTTTTSRDSSFHITRSGYKILGGYNHSDERDWVSFITFLSGDIGTQGYLYDNSYHVVIVAPQDNQPMNTDPLLDGLTIRDGLADGTSLLNGTSAEGGGMFIDTRNYGVGFTTQYVDFTNNYAQFRGGAIYFEHVDPTGVCAVVINNSKFSGNLVNNYGAAVYVNGESTDGMMNPQFNNCSFANNTAFAGGAIYSYTSGQNSHSLTTISNSSFTNNYAYTDGGAIKTDAVNDGEGGCDINKCIFTGNHVSWKGGAVESYGNNGRNYTSITNSTFSNNFANDGGAVYLIAGDYLTTDNTHTTGIITNCVFAGNSSYTTAAAIGIDGGSNPNEVTITNCTFNNNATGGNANNVIQNDNFINSHYPTNIYNCIFGNDLIESNTAKFNIAYSLINDNNFSGNGNVISGTAGYVDVSDPDGADNTFNTADDGLRLSASSAAIDAGLNLYAPTTDIVSSARPFGTSVDMGAYESLEDRPITSCPAFTSLYVDGSKALSGDGSSWSSAFKTVSEALYVANQCTVVQNIYVAEGTYHPANNDGSISLNRFTSFRIFRNNIRIYGGYPAGGSGVRNIETHPTILSGDINNDDNGLASNGENNYHILIIYPDSLAGNAINSSNTIVDGFTFMGGNAGSSSFMYTNIRGREILYWLGGAIYNKADYASSFAESSPLVSNCTFINNDAYRGGGAIYSTANHGKTAPLFENCIFRNNHVVSGEVGGAAIAIDGYSYPNPPLSHLYLEKCVFENNHALSTGGAIAATFGVGIRANNSVFHANTANDGAAINLLSNSSQNAVFNNCLFTDNIATNTGAVLNGGLAAFSNCTFNNNNTNNGNNEVFGALAVYAEPFKRITVSNCIFNGDIIYDNGDGLLTTKYILKNTFINQNTFAGNNNFIGPDPNLTNPSDPVGADGKFGTADDGLQLISNSFCVNAGDTTGLSLPSTDLRGNNRVNNNLVDLGCYELAYSCTLSLSETHANATCNTAHDGSITVSSTGGTGVVTYYLSPGNLINTTGLFTGLAAGNYNFHAEDANNCNVSANAIVAVTDVVPPVISTCPVPRNATGSAPSCLAIVPDFTTAVVASDNCSTASQLVKTQSPAAGSLVGGGVTTVTITVSDAFGNASSCNTTFTVTGSVPARPSAITAEAGYSNVCSIVGTSTSVRYSVTQVSNYTYNWTIPQNTVIDSGSNGNKIRLRFLAGYVFNVNDSLKVRAVSGCGVGVLYNKLAIKSTVPSVPSSTTGYSLCGAGTATLKATATTGNTIDWYDANGILLQAGTASGSNTFNPFVTVTTVYYAAVRSLTTGCSSQRVGVTATVNSLPGAPVIASITPICARGVSTITVVASAGVTYSWFSAAVGGTAIRTGNSFTTGTTPIDLTYYVEAKNTATGCVSLTRTIATAIVYPKPEPPTISMPLVCGSLPVTMNATSGPNEVIDWYRGSVLVATATNSYTTPYNVSISSFGDVYYAVARNLSTGCVSEKRSQSVHTYSIPAAPVNTTSNPARCGPGVITLSASGGSATVLWYDAGGTYLGGGNNFTPNITNTTTFYAGTVLNHGTSNGPNEKCFSLTRTPITAIVNPVPAPPISAGDVTSCAGVPVMLTATAGPNEFVDWYSNATGFTALKTSDTHLFVNIPVPLTGHYYAETRTSANCTSSTRTLILATFNAIPAAPAISMPLVCGSLPVTMNATSGPNEVIDWYRGSVLVATASNSYTTPYNVSTSSIGDVYYAVARNLSTGCVSEKRSQSVHTYSIPAAPVNTTSNPARCGPGVITVSASGGSATVLWYDAGGTYLGGGNNFMPNITNTTTFYAGTVLYHGTSNAPNERCLSLTRTPVTAIVNPIPAPPINAGGDTRCGAGSVTVRAVTAPGDFIDWYANATGGNPVSTGTQFSFNISAPGTVTYYAQARNSNGCVSAIRTGVSATVTTSTFPPISGGNVARCGAGTVTVTATAGIGETIEWYSAVAGGTLLFSGPSYSTNITASVNFYAAARGTSGCLSSTRTAVKAFVSTRIPGTPGVITGPADICPFLGTATAVYSIAPVSYATSYDWTVPAGTSIVSGAGTASITLLITSLNASVDTISVKARSGCGVSTNASSIAINIDACPPTGKRVNVPAATNVQARTKTETATVDTKTGAVLYPNPSHGDFNVRIKTGDTEQYGTVQLIGMNGNIISSKKVVIDKEGMLITNIVANGLTAGIYQVRYIIGHKTGVLKAVIIN